MAGVWGVRAVLVAVLLPLACGRIGYDGGIGTGDGPDPPDAGRSGDDSGAGSRDGSALGTEANYVFVSSQTRIPGDLGSVQAADTWCTEQAGAAGLPGEYVAWLSSMTASAGDRIGQARGWIRPDGLAVADQRTQLSDGNLWHMINRDENGARVDATVATGTTASGTTSIMDPIGPIIGTATCDDYTATVHESGLTAGRSTRAGERFSKVGVVMCDDPSQLYCFGVSNASQVAIDPKAGRLAFLSASAWFPGDGLASADAHCQSEADAAGLTGQYRALLATDSASAAARFSLAGPAWVRVDGVRLAGSPAAVMNAELDAAIQITASGELADGLIVWTGYDALALHTANDLGTDTCNDWTVAGGSGGRGEADSGSTGMFTAAGPSACGNSARLYCLQN